MNSATFERAAPSQAEERKDRVVRIDSGRQGLLANLKEIWEYRELLYFLTWRDIKVRYKQTVLGGAWALLQPLAAMAVFSIFFGRLADIPSEGLPYPVFALAGLVPWMFFSNGVTQAANSFIMTPDLVTKVYFPRMVVPFASTLATLVDFAISFFALVVITLAYGIVPSIQALVLIPLFLMLVSAAAGVGLWLSALNVEYRDVRYVVPFLMQFWLFATPVAYPSDLLSEPWRTLFGLNPMTGIVEGFRYGLLGADNGAGAMILVSAFATVGLLTSGSFYFRRVERQFADVI
jgi:lipopolysaccharide transport system permease protein